MFVDREVFNMPSISLYVVHTENTFVDRRLLGHKTLFDYKENNTDKLDI